ncbi:MAG: class F sortase [Clostridia bacterium]|nr:class F sortase [Clostridia bacterium]
MDEKKINNEITEENAPITEGVNADAADTHAVEAEQSAEAVQNDQAAQEKALKKKKRRRVRRIIAAALLAYAAIILFRQYVYIPGKYEAPPTPVPTDSGISWDVTETPEPTPYVQKIPVKMYFTAREVSFPVERVGIVPYTDADGNQLVNELGQKVYTMGTLDTEKAAAWLETSSSPGEYGNAIFNGHVTWKKIAGVFSLLPKMEAGEEIVVEYDDGSTMRFIVERVNIFGIYDEPADVMLFDTGDSRMTLITCYGESWNSELGTREQRCVVVAKPANPDEIIYPYYEEEG